MNSDRLDGKLIIAHKNVHQFRHQTIFNAATEKSRLFDIFIPDMPLEYVQVREASQR